MRTDRRTDRLFTELSTWETVARNPVPLKNQITHKNHKAKVHSGIAFCFSSPAVLATWPTNEHRLRQKFPLFQA